MTINILEGRTTGLTMQTQPLVLVIDDQPELAELLQTILEDDGYAVELCTEARQALAQIFAVKPDLIMLDVRMPGADGWQILKALRENSATSEIPVIMMSAAADKLLIFEELSARYKAQVLLKPFNNKNMLSQVQSLAPLANPI